MSKEALIGYSGFVGSNLARQHAFTDLYNSQNIDAIKGREYDLVVCAGASAVMWVANKEPQEDWKKINSLLERLKTIKTKRFVLISTIDVYPSPSSVDESILPEPQEHNRPYGKHRLMLEKEVAKLFNTTVLRLPALFGRGIKKNFIFDLIHNHMLDYTHPESSFQYYNLDNVFKDITFALTHNIPVLNIATEPVKAKHVAQQSLGITLNPSKDAKILSYDMHSQYATLFGSSSEKYLYTLKEVLPELIQFIKSERTHV